MNLIKVNSSNLEAIGFTGNVLFVEFKTGSVYSYAPVSEEHYKEMLRLNEAGESVGKYFHKNIKTDPKISYKVVSITEETVERIDTLLGSKPGVLAGKGVIKK
jgi:hypothetical protein